MKHTPTNLKKYYLTKTQDLDYKFNSDRHIRKMRDRLWKVFDETWVKYNNNQANFKQWETALNNWLNAEAI